jgi:hypothetical protein
MGGCPCEESRFLIVGNSLNACLCNHALTFLNLTHVVDRFENSSTTACLSEVTRRPPST